MFPVVGCENGWFAGQSCPQLVRGDLLEAQSFLHLLICFWLLVQWGQLMKLHNFDLKYNGVLVAHLRNCYCSDYTWYGSYELAKLDSGELERRLLEFVVFSEEWNNRLDKNPTSPPSASEFAQFGDLIDSKDWRVTAAGEAGYLIAGAPAFLGHQSILWRMRDNVEHL
jgi:hypothetical protein